jgi:parallel beta-helix repeat protein/predicted outer membrane repeat protein
VPANGSTNSVTFIITQNSSITWLWKIQYELSIEILLEGSGTVDVSPAGENSYYDEDAVVTLTANPDPAYVFGYWGGDLTGTNNPETLTMDGPKSVTANFGFPICVDGANGQDINDGLTWETAVKTIQKGIDLATSGWTVLVANGTYTGTGNKNLDFNGKAIHLNSVGGAGNCFIDCENSGRGFYFGSGEDVSSVVEGFTMSNGVADSGGAVDCENGSSPTIANCTFSKNSATHGGGVYCESDSNPTILDCTFSKNSATYGGTVYCYSSSPTITNCTFSENSHGYLGGGGAVYCSSSSPTITNCTFSENSAGEWGLGGAIRCSSSSPTITNCTFSRNSISTYGSGGAICCSSSSPTITNCRFIGNSAGEYGNGGAVYCSSSSSPTITNCTFGENSVSTYGNGGAVYCSSSSPTITNCTFWGNSAGEYGHGGAVYGSSSNPTIANCRFSANSAGWSGGAVYCYWYSSPIITNCTFSANSAGSSGGAVHCSSSSPAITNCRFSGNSAGEGGAVCCSSSSPTIINCTFSGNSAGEGGAVYCSSSSSPTITNSILWSDSATLGGNEIYIQDSSSLVTLNNSDVTPGSYGGYPANITENSCIHSDPLFVDAAGGDYHLQAGSPSIDAGDNSLVPEGVTTDLDGNPRILDGNTPPDGTATVDIGAYEYQP